MVIFFLPTTSSLPVQPTQTEFEGCSQYSFINLSKAHFAKMSSDTLVRSIDKVSPSGHADQTLWELAEVHHFCFFQVSSKTGADDWAMLS